MFNIGPLELAVLVLVAVVVFGPDRLPALARDAARVLRQLREMATGARNQLKNELGPEFSDIDLQALRDLRALNPRTAIQRALLGDDDEPLPPAVGAPQPPPAAPRPLGRNEKAPYDEDAT
jgi:sec-independent protein translocase protein TatB